MESKRLLVLSAMLFAAPALADNCSGEYTYQNLSASPAQLESGAGKLIHFTGADQVTSPDSPYVGSGSCTGYIFEKDGQATSTFVCFRTTANGDTWGMAGMREPESKRGKWRQISGTGKLAKTVGSSGWFEDATADEKGGTGKWGGSCVGVN
jgi:hypothetical protein